MGNHHAIREIMRELNTQYLHDKTIPLDIALFILGPSGENVRLVVDRIGSGKMINQLSYMNGKEQGRSTYYGYYSLQYGDYYSVESDNTCEIQIWREIERAEP